MLPFTKGAQSTAALAWLYVIEGRPRRHLRRASSPADRPGTATIRSCIREIPMSILQGLPPIENPQARALILGSMPGGMSLRLGRYYAHPQNRFWPFMGELVGARPDLPYEQRIGIVRDAGIALWDVLAQCEREGSLDSAIRAEVANDFRGFLASHPNLQCVLFNGAKAEQSFRRHVLPMPGSVPVGLRRLPSTSPANASQGEAAKLEAWRDALRNAGVRVLD
jgi:TDG/mug DNA glycosylase family protein